MKKSLQTLTLAAWAFSSIGMAKDVATINGKGLSEDQYKEALAQLGPQADMVKGNPEIRKQFLDHIIESTLLAQEAKNQDIDDSDRFKALVETAKRDILAKLYLEKYIADNSTDAKLKEYFEKNKAKFTEKEVKAQHILFPEKDKATAEKVLKEVKAKNNFDDNLKKYATEKNGSKGGDLNWFKQGRMVPEFEKAAFGTEKGNVYPQLIKTQFGYHIIKVVDVRGGDSVKFEDKKADVEQEIRMNARTDLVKSLRDKAQVKVDDEALGKMQL
ncbi:MAG TPA: peptidylprolyl isomerase [Oligoflexus sp.]|uniref:peptidylprolyl isomerase n=1 Tax=Oligoflexus sp. TaxID=1971216 RepID=UPI002D806F7D|nr:peptidylprolyl isomerase [Oligoflexus sp.]HET9240255.1 peptidylprolyl isomerase [Oligoflexus sp.]